MKISVVIPTYLRERVLVETIEHVLALKPAEVLVVDQTPVHEQDTLDMLSKWDGMGLIRWIRRSRPSIPAAMNAGLMAAREEVVLFLDDDVIPAPSLIDRHLEAHRRHSPLIVVGQVLQPGEDPVTLASKEAFRFCSDAPAWIADAMAGNMSVLRRAAIEAGGFDENFRGAAYRFEKEFALRMAGSRGVCFEPRASIRHLRAERGGTRAAGSHLDTIRPHHAVGAYYYELVTGAGATGAFRRLLRSVTTRHHLRHPWKVPVTLTAEAGGLLWALRLWLSGPKRLQIPTQND